MMRNNAHELESLDLSLGEPSLEELIDCLEEKGLSYYKIIYSEGSIGLCIAGNIYVFFDKNVFSRAHRVLIWPDHNLKTEEISWQSLDQFFDELLADESNPFVSRITKNKIYKSLEWQHS
jgi:hypothetical protein